MSAPPPLSIGLPVYNGDRYLAASIDSLLSQDFGDFELHISDNASDDRTQDIARAFAANDSRIRYERLDENKGASENHNRVFHAARGRYFKWAAHDDICGPGFLGACIAGIEADPSAVLCHARSVMINARGQILGEVATEQPADQPSPAERFRQIIGTPHMCIIVFGVIRRSAMAQTKLLAPYVGSDRTLLAELALHGRLLVNPDAVFLRRAHPDSSIHKHVDETERLRWFDPSLKGKGSAPTWRRWREYASAMRRAPLSRADRARAIAELARWPLAHHHTGPRVAAMLAQEAVRAVRR